MTRVPGVTASLIAYGGEFEVRQSVEDLKGVSTRGLSETVILHMTAGTEQALGAGDLLIDATTAKSDHLSVGGTVPVKFALTGPFQTAHRRDLQGERPHRELCRQPGLLPVALPEPAPGCRAAQDRRQRLAWSGR